VPPLGRVSIYSRFPGLLGQRSRLRCEPSIALNEEIAALRPELVRFSRAQSGCRALQTHDGIGPLTSVAIGAELGDCRRFSSSSDAVRHTGLDITVHSSDSRRARGHLARQGPGILRWALFEAAVCAARPASPDHPYYLEVRVRLGHQRAVLSVARKLARWCHHTLRALGEEALTTA
jgi:transposase